MSINFVPPFMPYLMYSESDDSSIGSRNGECEQYPLFGRVSNGYSASSECSSDFGFDSPSDELFQAHHIEATPERPGTLIAKTVSAAAKQLNMDSFRSLSEDVEEEVRDIRDLSSGLTGRGSSTAPINLPERWETPEVTHEEALLVVQNPVSFFPNQDRTGSKLLSQLSVGLRNPEAQRPGTVYWLLESYKMQKEGFESQQKYSASKTVMDQMTELVQDFVDLPKKDQNLSPFHRTQLSDLLVREPNYSEIDNDNPSTTSESESEEDRVSAVCVVKRFYLDLTAILSNSEDQSREVVSAALIRYKSERAEMTRTAPNYVDRMDTLVADFANRPGASENLEAFEVPITSNFIEDAAAADSKVFTRLGDLFESGPRERSFPKGTTLREILGL